MPKFVDTYESFDELMRFDFSTLEKIKFDFAAIPFGYGPLENNCYAAFKNNSYYIGPRSWLATATAHLTFLTTEAVVTEVVEKVLQLRKDSRQPLRLNLTDLPGIYPIRVPVRLDSKARANQPSQRLVSALADEVLSYNSNAVIISDGTEKSDRVLSFQAAKGRNGLEDRDITLIVTNLAPAKYAELNVLGQWLKRTDIIPMHYHDQIDQGVGRNRGFRHKNPNTQTQIITSIRLWEAVLSRLNDPDGRSLLYLDRGIDADKSESEG